MPEYELMKIVQHEKSWRRPQGIDSESETLGNGKDIIKFLLKNDESVKDYKIVKRGKKA